jgi:hypothetical protein
MLSVKSTWENVRFCSDSWEEMFSSFRGMVSEIYKEWYQHLKDSLDPEELEFSNLFVSITLLWNIGGTV